MAGRSCEKVDGRGLRGWSRETREACAKKFLHIIIFAIIKNEGEKEAYYSYSHRAFFFLFGKNDEGYDCGIGG